MNRRDLIKWGLASGAAFATTKSTKLWADKGSSGGSGSGVGAGVVAVVEVVAEAAISFPGEIAFPTTCAPVRLQNLLLHLCQSMPIAQPVDPTTLTGPLATTSPASRLRIASSARRTSTTTSITRPSITKCLNGK